MRAKDLSGQRFGRLVAMKRVANATKNHGVVWLCKCDCGSETEVASGWLVTGNTASCGCLFKDKLRERSTTHGHAKGNKLSHIYHSWQSMRTRCTNQNRWDYKYYGGRGISICDKWNKFEGFLEDMGPSWVEGLSLDRIDVDGNYEPLNCRWATRHEQRINSRNSKQYKEQWNQI